MKKLIIAALVAVGLAGAAWLGWERGSARSTAATGAAATRTDAAAGSVAPDAPAGGASTANPDTNPQATVEPAPPARRAALVTALLAAPMPPPGAPLAESFDVLAAKAAAGDTLAACRLAFDLDECASLPWTRTQRQLTEDRLIDGKSFPVAGRSPEQMRTDQETFAAQMAEKEERLDAMCRDVPAARLDTAQEWFLRAAEGGNRAALRRLLMPTWRSNARDQLRMMQRTLDLYPRIIEIGLSNGDLDHVKALARMHAGAGTMFVSPVEQSPYEAYKYNRVAELVEGKPSTGHLWVRMRDALSAEERARADAEAAALYDRSFRDTKPGTAGPHVVPPARVVQRSDFGPDAWRANQCAEATR